MVWLTLFLLLVNLTNRKGCQKNLKADWNPGTWVLIWEYSAIAFEWIPTWQGLGGFQKSLHLCTLDESALSIEKVNEYSVTFVWLPSIPQLSDMVQVWQLWLYIWTARVTAIHARWGGYRFMSPHKHEVQSLPLSVVNIRLIKSVAAAH